MKWFKFYGQDWLTDSKVISLSPIDRLCFVTLLCLASSSDTPGTIRGCTEEDILRMTHLIHPFGLDEDGLYTAAQGCFKRLLSKGMITNDNVSDVTVVNFSKRQGENLTGYERVKKSRQKKKVAQQSRNLNDNVSDVINDNVRVEESRVDKNRIHTNTYPLDKLAGIISKKKVQ